MQLQSLSHHTHLIPEIAQLKYQEYHRLVPDRSVDDFSQSLKWDANETGIPIAYVLLDSRGFIGMVSLRVADLASHSHLTPWLGGLFVHPLRRGQGMGTFLMREAVARATQSGYARLYLYTPNQAEWYARLGWSKIEDTTLNKSVVTVMSLSLK